MSQENIRKAFEKKLISYTPVNTISFEAAEFKAPTSGAYFVCRLIPAEVQNPTFGDNYHREVGVFSVVVCTPVGKGSQLAALKAGELKELFYRSLSLFEGGDCVIVDRTPSIGSGYIDGNKYCIPVRIRYYSNQN